MPKLHTQFDILFIADFRVGDTGAGASVEALAALAEQGYRIAVLPWISAIPADPFQIHPGLEKIY